MSQYISEQKGGYKMGRVLLTGSSGFLGLALSKALLQWHEVIPLDRDWNVVPLDIDYIIHCGAYGNMYDQTSEMEIFRVNVKRTFDLLEATKVLSYKKFVYVSSSSVSLPTQTMYSVTKKMVENLIKAYNKPISIVRPYSVTGVGEQSAHLIPTLIDAAFTGKVIPFIPDPCHDFIDISDVVKSIIRIMNFDSLEAYQHPVFDLGSSDSYSNQEVLNIVENITGKKVHTKYTPAMRSYDTRKWESPISWSTKSLNTSIKEMVEAYGKK